jgi:hypothetical protein
MLLSAQLLEILVFCDIIRTRHNISSGIIIIIIIQFFIYLRAELNSQWPITESARIHRAIIQHMTKLQQNNNNNNNNNKVELSL